MDDVQLIPAQVYSDMEDSAKETYEPLQSKIQAPIVEVLKPETFYSPQQFDISEPNSRQQRSQQKFFSATQMLLTVAVTIFATLSVVFMGMYFKAKGKSKPCDCQNNNSKNMNMKETSEPYDGQIGQNTSRNHTEQKCRPCVYQNCNFVTNSSKISKNDSMENGQCPFGCVRNLTTRKFNEEKSKPCNVCQNCSLVTNSSKNKNYSMGNGRCPVGCVRTNSMIRKYTERQW